MADKVNSIESGFEIFTKIFMKYDVLSKQPRNIGNNITISASNIHTIEAIGKRYANTVTSLSNYFMITKGAISQVITKLYKDGYIKKTETENKVVLLELSASGKQALKAHDKYNLAIIGKLQSIEKKYSKKEIETFLRILSEVDDCFGELLNEVKK
ncbi:MAG: winged helix-turn-helix transcriptional regulator [Chitinophagaceae bacterium]|nr:winged helix-turn-helix transcriptional regulator [Chitinophagaceae bacterium]